MLMARMVQAANRIANGDGLRERRLVSEFAPYLCLSDWFSPYRQRTYSAVHGSGGLPAPQSRVRRTSLWVSNEVQWERGLA